VQPGIELDLPRRAVVSLDQPALVVEQNLLGDAAEMSERALQPGKSAFLALVPEVPPIDPP